MFVVEKNKRLSIIVSEFLLAVLIIAGFAILVAAIFEIFSWIERIFKLIIRRIFKDYDKIEESENIVIEDETDMFEELERFSELKNKGIITEEEFEKEKKRILNQ